MKLGVVSVNFRRPDMLIGAINSLETVRPHKFFIVDRARLGPEVPSLAAAWNRGIEAALAWGAAWVLVTSDDVIFHPCTVDHLIERAEQRGYGFLSPYNVKTRLGLGPADFQALPAPEDGLDEQAADYSCFLLSPDLYREIGPFDEAFVPAYFEDSDYNLRLGLAGRPGMLTSYAPFFHYGGASGGIPAEVARRNRDYFVAKWKEVVPWVEAFATSGGRLPSSLTPPKPDEDPDEAQGRRRPSSPARSGL